MSQNRQLTRFIPFRVSFDPEDLRIEGNPLRVNPSFGKWKIPPFDFAQGGERSRTTEGVNRMVLPEDGKRGHRGEFKIFTIPQQELWATREE